MKELQVSIEIEGKQHLVGSIEPILLALFFS